MSGPSPIKNQRDALRRQLRQYRKDADFHRKEETKRNQFIKTTLGKLKDGTLDRAAFKKNQWVENGRLSQHDRVGMFRSLREHKGEHAATAKAYDKLASAVEKQLIKLDNDKAKARKNPLKRRRR